MLVCVLVCECACVRTSRVCVCVCVDKLGRVVIRRVEDPLGPVPLAGVRARVYV